MPKIRPSVPVSTRGHYVHTSSWRNTLAKQTLIVLAVVAWKGKASIPMLPFLHRSTAAEATPEGYGRVPHFFQEKLSHLSERIPLADRNLCVGSKSRSRERRRADASGWKMDCQAVTPARLLSYAQT